MREFNDTGIYKSWKPWEMAGAALGLVLCFAIAFHVTMLQQRFDYCYAKIGAASVHTCGEFALSKDDCISNWLPDTCEWRIDCINGTITTEECGGCCR